MADNSGWEVESTRPVTADDTAGWQVDSTRPATAADTAPVYDSAANVGRNPDGSIAYVGSPNTVDPDGTVNVNSSSDPDRISAWLAKHPDDPANNLTAPPPPPPAPTPSTPPAATLAAPAGPQPSPGATDPNAQPRGWADDLTGGIATLLRGTGVGDELNAAIAAPFNATASALAGNGFDLVGGFNQNLAAQRQAEAGFEAAHPHIAALAKGTGLIAPLAASLLTGGETTPGVLAQSAQSAGAAPGLLNSITDMFTPSTAPGSFLGNLGRGMVRAGLGAAGYAAADAGTVQQRIQAAANAVHDPVNLALGALGGAASPIAAKVTSVGGNTLDRIGGTVQALQTLKNKAYQAVDDMGAHFTPDAVKSLLTAMNDDLSHTSYDPDAPSFGPVKAAMNYAQKKLGTGLPVSMGDLDQLRQEIGDLTFDPNGGAASRLGQLLKGNIDEFVGSAGPHNMAPQAIPGLGPISPVDPYELRVKLAVARDMNTRFKKAEAINEAAQVADLRTGATYAGNNIDNATRQQILPLINPKSSQQITNLTPDEQAAAKQVIKPGWLADTARSIGRYAPHGLTGATEAMGLLTALASGHYNTAGTIAAGMGGAKLAHEAANANTRANVGRLMTLVAHGGSNEAVAAAQQLQRLGRLTPQVVQLLNRSSAQASTILGALRQQRQPVIVAPRRP